MITVFTPKLLRADTLMVAAGTPTSDRTIALGVLLSLYPFGQFVASAERNRYFGYAALIRE